MFLIPHNAIYFIFLLLFLSSPIAHGQNSDFNPGPLQKMWAEIPDGTILERLSYSWPGDDNLCDNYEGSDGDRMVNVYQTKEGQILVYEDFGAYCQGDSEYGMRCYYDFDGSLVLRETGFNMYVEQIYALFENREFVKLFIAPTPYASNRSFEVDRFMIRPGGSEEVSKMLDDMKEEVTARYATLMQLLPGLQDDDYDEALTTTEALREFIEKGAEIKPAVFRKPGIPEMEAETWLRINGEYIHFYPEPSLNDERIESLSFHNCLVQIQEMGRQTISPFSEKDQWLKVRYFIFGTNEETEYEAWILASSLMPVLISD